MLTGKFDEWCYYCYYCIFLNCECFFVTPCRPNHKGDLSKCSKCFSPKAQTLVFKLGRVSTPDSAQKPKRLWDRGVGGAFELFDGNYFYLLSVSAVK